MRRKSTIWGIGLIIFGLLALAVMAALGSPLGSSRFWGAGVGRCQEYGPWRPPVFSSDRRSDEPVEQHFLERMVAHHEEAISLAEVALTRARHEELRSLAQSIVTTQSAEVELMKSWFREWFGREPRWGPGEIDAETATAGVEDFDRAFIRWMVPHHEMGVMMARMVLVRTERPELEGLARQIIDTQRKEIDQMRRWYREWYR